MGAKSINQHPFIVQGEIDKYMISYNKLWHILVDKGMTQTDLQRAIKCSSNTIGQII